MVLLTLGEHLLILPAQACSRGALPPADRNEVAGYIVCQIGCECRLHSAEVHLVNAISNSRKKLVQFNYHVGQCASALHQRELFLSSQVDVH